MNVLFLVSSSPYYTNTVRDYDQAFSLYSRHAVTVLDLMANDWTIDFNRFDLVLVSYSFFSCVDVIDPLIVKKFRMFQGPKVGIFQDEYTYFLRARESLLKMGFTLFITCVPRRFWRDVFRDEFASMPLVQALTGYVPENLLQLPPPRPIAERRWHIGYRSRLVPFRYGRLTMEKYTIGVEMRKRCEERGIPANIDVTTAGRIYGDAWPAFIRDCRTMLMTESGSNVFDFSGKVIPQLNRYLAEHPTASFEAVHKLFLEDIDDKILMNQISPKAFETAAMGTALICFEGEYSGVIKPDIHYIPLKKDYSNVDEVFEKLRDTDLLETLAQRTRDDIILSGRYSYQRYIARVDGILEGLPRSQPLYKTRRSLWN